MVSNRIYVVLLVMLAVNVPGFIKFDATALEQQHSVVNMQSLSRVILFVCVSASFFFVMVMIPALRRRSVIVWPDFLGMRLVILLFVFYMISSLIILRASELLLSLFRIGEWMLAIFLVASAFDYRRMSSIDVNNQCVKVIKVTSILIVGIVSIAAVLSPDLALYGGSTEQARLGGQVYHPHIVGMSAAIGAIIFWYFPKSPVDRIISLLMVIALFMSKSRTDLLLFLLSISLIVIFSFEKNKYKFLFKWLSVFSSIVVVLILGVGLLEYTRMSSFEEVSSLNSRVVVWAAAIELFPQFMNLGMGYVAGVSHLGDFVSIGYYRPRHADSDFITAFLSGGVVAGILTVYIYSKLIIDILRVKIVRLYKLIYIGIVLHVGISAVVVSVTSWVLGMHGIFLLLMLRHVAYLKKTEKKRV